MTRSARSAPRGCRLRPKPPPFQRRDGCSIPVSSTPIPKGMGDCWTLELLLTAAPWITGNRTLEDRYLSTQLGAVEMVLKGCTACYDLSVEWPLPTAEGLAQAAQAYADVGMRAVLAPMVADRSFFEAIPGLMDALPAPLQAH